MLFEKEIKEKIDFHKDCLRLLGKNTSMGEKHKEELTKLHEMAVRGYEKKIKTK